MNYRNITDQYYSKWLGYDLTQRDAGVHFIEYDERNHCQKGTPKRYDLYIMKIDDTIVISYGTNIADKISVLREQITKDNSFESVVNAVRQLYDGNIEHLQKYVFAREMKPAKEFARSISMDEYILYLEFFRTMNPNCNSINWLWPYFYQMLQKDNLYGAFVDGRLVSCTDTLNIPYMEKEVSEINVNTLEEYRQLGYAEDVCITSIHNLIGKGICPLWSSLYEDHASKTIAHHIGFENYAEVITLSMH